VHGVYYLSLCVRVAVPYRTNMYTYEHTYPHNNVSDVANVERLEDVPVIVTLTIHTVMSVLPM
jgi:hypothetical protein